VLKICLREIVPADNPNIECVIIQAFLHKYRADDRIIVMLQFVGRIPQIKSFMAWDVAASIARIGLETKITQLYRV
jgi:hypothetical protein